MDKQKRCEKPEGCDLEFRPKTYWPRDGKTIGRETNELLRRIEAAEKTGDWSKVKMPATPFGVRGGDFLPPFERMEREIARISLESTTSDVISIRAQPSACGIKYRIVDEYESDQLLPRQSSSRPLTMREMIKLINGINDGEGSPEAMRNYSLYRNSREEVEEIRTFVSVSSDYYPELERWFEVDADRWVVAKLRELGITETAEEAKEKA